MTEYLRVKQTDTNNGVEFSIPKTQYDFAPKAFEVLDGKPATDAGGNPLPPKPKTTVDQAAEEKKAKAPGSRQAPTPNEEGA